MSMKPYIFPVILILVQAAAGCRNSNASPEGAAGFHRNMVFVAVPPDEPTDIYGTAWNIYGEGMVDAGSADRLETLIRNKSIPARSTLFLNADGGDIEAAMALGKAIRQAGLFTNIGALPDTPGDSAPALCQDAGALAFFGGAFRWAEGDSVVAFTDAFLSKADSNMFKYVLDMGIEFMLLVHLSEVLPETGKAFLKDRDLSAMKIRHTGYEDGPQWSVDIHDGREVLMGERHTIRGVNTILIYCMDSGPKLHVVFDGEGREEEITQTMTALTLALDDEYYLLDPDRIEHMKAVDGLVHAVIALEASLLNLLPVTERIGLLCRTSHESGIFMGFDSMDFTGGANKVQGVLEECMPTDRN